MTYTNHSGRQYRRAKESGSCMVCGGDVYKEGAVWCEYHNTLYRGNRKRKEAEQREAGCCIVGDEWYGRCKEPLAETSKYYCVDHLAIRTEMQRRRRKGEPPLETGYRFKSRAALAKRLNRAYSSVNEMIRAAEIRKAYPDDERIQNASGTALNVLWRLRDTLGFPPREWNGR